MIKLSLDYALVYQSPSQIFVADLKFCASLPLLKVHQKWKILNETVAKREGPNENWLYFVIKKHASSVPRLPGPLTVAQLNHLIANLERVCNDCASDVICLQPKSRM